MARQEMEKKAERANDCAEMKLEVQGPTHPNAMSQAARVFASDRLLGRR